jgi:hypothetical protein
LRRDGRSAARHNPAWGAENRRRHSTAPRRESGNGETVVRQRSLEFESPKSKKVGVFVFSGNTEAKSGKTLKIRKKSGKKRKNGKIAQKPENGPQIGKPWGK